MYITSCNTISNFSRERRNLLKLSHYLGRYLSSPKISITINYKIRNRIVILLFLFRLLYRFSYLIEELYFYRVTFMKSNSVLTLKRDSFRLLICVKGSIFDSKVSLSKMKNDVITCYDVIKNVTWLFFPNFRKHLWNNFNISWIKIGSILTCSFFWK